jgi:hypothetical protein
MQKKTQLRLVAFVLFQGAFFAYGDCLYNSDLILLLFDHFSKRETRHD